MKGPTIRVITTFLRTATTIVLVGTVAPAWAFDLTGHWVGKYTCRGFDGAKFTSGNKTSTLAITQTGNTIAANIDAAIAPPDGNFRYNGVAIPNTKSPDTKGEAVLLGCRLANQPAPTNPDTTPLDGELARLVVKTKADTFKASIQASSIFQDDFPEVSSCKYSYKRVDTIDPVVAPCPP